MRKCAPLLLEHFEFHAAPARRPRTGRYSWPIWMRSCARNCGPATWW
jgi:hypothetical protein